jgi:hypothetical protein
VRDQNSGLLHLVSMDWDSSPTPGGKRVGLKGDQAIILRQPLDTEGITVAADFTSLFLRTRPHGKRNLAPVGGPNEAIMWFQVC